MKPLQQQNEYIYCRFLTNQSWEVWNKNGLTKKQTRKENKKVNL